MAELPPVLAAIYERDNGRCRLCDKELKPNPKDCVANLVVPAEQGGPDEFFNLQLCCSSCDKQRGKLSNREYEQRLYTKNRKAWEAMRRAQARHQTTTVFAPHRGW